MKTILKNVHIVDPATSTNQKADIVIENNIITFIGAAPVEGDANVVECNGAIASPGFIDMHVHLREPGREDKETVETGCNAAAAGGFTAVACMPNTTPCIDSEQVVTLIKQKAVRHAVDVFPIAAATVNREGEVLAPMAELHDAGAVGFSDDGVAIKTAQILRRTMEYAKMFDMPIIEHCEDPSLMDGNMNEGFNSTLFGVSGLPSVSEDLIVMRDILMSEYTGAKLHIAHISTKGAVQLVRDAKKRGIRVTAEVAPHHFTFDDSMLAKYDTNYKMNPPLRTKEDVAAMLEGLRDGTIDVIASDHAPHSLEEKENEFEYAPNGILGLETMLGAIFTELYHKGVLTLEQIIEKLAVNPRKVLGMQVPKIEVGAEPNISLFFPDEEWVVDINKFKSKSRNSPYHGSTLKGKPFGIVNRGKIYVNGTYSAV